MMIDGEVRRILVVDDYAATAEMLCILFRILGYEATSAESGGEAVRRARELTPHLILLDIALPDVNGFDVVRALRSDPRTRNAYVVALSGWYRPCGRQLATKDGFDEYLLKPIDVSALRAVLRKANAPHRTSGSRGDRADRLVTSFSTHGDQRTSHGRA